MADKYRNFEELSWAEISGIDFGISVRRARDGFAVIAVHGGGIEPGTSEIADAVAGGQFSFYGFEGLKSSGNSDLHITSTRFDEPMCLTLIGQCESVLTIHGEQSEDGEGVFVGGLDETLGGRVGEALAAEGFAVRKHPDPGLQGLEPENVCNRGKSGRGVQLELSRSIRREMFLSLSEDGRKCTTRTFRAFVDTLRSVLAEESQPAMSAGRGER